MIVLSSSVSFVLYKPSSAVVVLDRLKQIEGNLVGGEKANDREFQERHWKRKNQSERRRALLAQLLARTEDEDGALMRVYDDIQEEVRAKTEAIKKYKNKVFLITTLIFLSCFLFNTLGVIENN